MPPSVNPGTKSLATRIAGLLSRQLKSALGKRLTSGVAWTLAGTVIGRALNLTSSIIVARLLGRAAFGEFGILQSTVVALSILANFGLGPTATRHLAQFRGSDPERAGRILGLSTVFAGATGVVAVVLMFVLAPWVSSHALAAPHLSPFLRVAGLSLLLWALGAAQTGALTGLEAFRSTAWISVVSGIVRLPIMIFGVRWWGLMGAVAGLVADASLQWLITHMALRRAFARTGIRMRLKGCLREWPVLWNFSLPMVLVSASMWAVNWGCNAILVNQPGGYLQMGLFTAANQWGVLITVMSGILGSAVLPVLSQLSGDRDHERFKKVLRWSLLVGGGTTAFSGLFLSIFSSLIMRTYGPGFQEGAGVMVLLVWSAVLWEISRIIGRYGLSTGRLWTGFFVNLLWGGLVLGLTWKLAKYGAWGVALAQLIGYGVRAVVANIFVFVKLRHPTSPFPASGATP